MTRNSRQIGAGSARSIVGRLARFFMLRGACVRVERLISLAADHEATPSDIADIDSHVAECAFCRALRAVCHMSGVELRERPRAQMPADLPARLLAAIAQEQLREQEQSSIAERSIGRRWTPRFAWATGVCLAAACLSGLVFLMHSHGPAGVELPSPVAVASKPEISIVPVASSLSKSNAFQVGAKRASVGTREETVASLPKQTVQKPAYRQPIAQAVQVASARVAVPQISHMHRSVGIHEGPANAAATAPNVTMAAIPPAPERTDSSHSGVSPAISAASPVAEAPATIVASAPSSIAPAVSEAVYQPGFALKSLAKRLRSTAGTETVNMASTGPRRGYSGTADIVGSTFN